MPDAATSTLLPMRASTLDPTVLTILQKLVESKTNKAPTNTNFPTFTGNPKDTPFHRWITIVGGILSTSEWANLSNPSLQTHVTDGNAHALLNNNLYSAIISKLKASAADYAVSKRDLNVYGIGPLNALRATYQNLLTASQLVAAERKFTDYYRAPDQSVESYVTELKIMLPEIIDSGGRMDRNFLKRTFVYNLGPECTSEIQRKMDMGSLGPE